MDTLFEGVYQKLISPDFGKNLGGELPLFIQPIPNVRLWRIYNTCHRTLKFKSSYGSSESLCSNNELWSSTSKEGSVY